MPNLENLRKQAKQVLRWHKERHFPVAAIIRGHLPRFSECSDSEILDRPFRLVDAQEVVARREGFENWPALTTGANAMKTESTLSTLRPALIFAEPQLFVTDFPAAIHFYEAVLGFTVAFVYGEPPFYGQVRRDGARLNLRLVPRHPFDSGERDREDLLSASIVVENVKELFLEFQAAGATFHHPLHTEPWGARTFTMKDPDGNAILFAE
jgi:uncharacterized glyoxalase superfamily protein PhnB